MSKSSNPIIASLVTLLLVACQSVPEPVIEAQQPEAVTTTVIESAPSAQSEAETAAEPIDYPQQTYLAAIDALKNGDTEGAIELLTRVSREAPDKPRLFTNLGLAYFSLQQDELSEQAFQQAVKRDSNDAVAYNHLGILLRHKGRFQEALVQYQRAIAIDAGYAPAQLNLGILFDLYLQDLEKALQQYQKYQVMSSEDNPRVSGWIVDIERRLKQADTQTQG